VACVVSARPATQLASVAGPRPTTATAPGTPPSRTAEVTSSPARRSPAAGSADTGSPATGASREQCRAHLRRRQRPDGAGELNEPVPDHGGVEHPADAA